MTGLRDRARAAMTACGARGFMRFAADGDALLLTDAAVRCGDGGAALRASLVAAGFACRAQGALLLITPEDALLCALCAREARTVAIDWASPLHPAQALAARLLRAPQEALTPEGRGFLLDAARLLWQPQERVLAGMAGLRGEAARLLRLRRSSGLAQAGAMLANWCDAQCDAPMKEKGDI